MNVKDLISNYNKINDQHQPKTTPSAPAKPPLPFNKTPITRPEVQQQIQTTEEVSTRVAIEKEKLEVNNARKMWEELGKKKHQHIHYDLPAYSSNKNSRASSVGKRQQPESPTTGMNVNAQKTIFEAQTNQTPTQAEVIQQNKLEQNAKQTKPSESNKTQSSQGTETHKPVTMNNYNPSMLAEQVVTGVVTNQQMIRTTESKFLRQSQVSSSSRNTITTMDPPQRDSKFMEIMQDHTHNLVEIPGQGRQSSQVSRNTLANQHKQETEPLVRQEEPQLIVELPPKKLLESNSKEAMLYKVFDQILNVSSMDDAASDKPNRKEERANEIMRNVFGQVPDKSAQYCIRRIPVMVIKTFQKILEFSIPESIDELELTEKVTVKRKCPVGTLY